MKKTAIATFAAAFLTAGAALAQSTTTFTLSSDDATKFKTWVNGQTVTASTAPSGFTATVGVAVPDTIMLYEVYASPEAFEAHWTGPRSSGRRRARRMATLLQSPLSFYFV